MVSRPGSSWIVPGRPATPRFVRPCRTDSDTVRALSFLGFVQHFGELPCPAFGLLVMRTCHLADEVEDQVTLADHQPGATVDRA